MTRTCQGVQSPAWIQTTPDLSKKNPSLAVNVTMVGLMKSLMIERLGINAPTPQVVMSLGTRSCWLMIYGNPKELIYLRVGKCSLLYLAIWYFPSSHFLSSSLTNNLLLSFNDSKGCCLNSRSAVRAVRVASWYSIKMSHHGGVPEWFRIRMLAVMTNLRLLESYLHWTSQHQNESYYSQWSFGCTNSVSSSVKSSGQSRRVPISTAEHAKRLKTSCKSLSNHPFPSMSVVGWELDAVYRRLPWTIYSNTNDRWVILWDNRGGAIPSFLE